MKALYKIFGIAILSAILISGCSKKSSSPTDSGNLIPTGSFSFTSTHGTFSVPTNSAIGYSYTPQTGQAAIIAGIGKSSQNDSAFVELAVYDTLHTLKKQNYSFDMTIDGLVAGAYLTYSSYINDSLSFLLVSGSVTVTNISSAAISGTFSGKAVTYSGMDTITVSNGSFSVPLKAYNGSIREDKIVSGQLQKFLQKR